MNDYYGPNEPEMDERKAEELEELEYAMEYLDGCIEEIESRRGSKYAIDLLTESITEQLPNDIDSLMTLIEKMGWKEKCRSYMDYMTNEIVDDANESWQP